jgi:hypothetical protein
MTLPTGVRPMFLGMMRRIFVETSDTSWPSSSARCMRLRM